MGHHVLLATGCLAIVLAVLLPTFVYPRLAVLPADPQIAQVQIGTGTVLVPDLKAAAGARVVKNADVTVTTFVSAAPGESGGDSVVWNLATSTKVEGHGMIDARVEKVSLNPRTGEPTNCCGDRLVTSSEDPTGKPITHRGFISFPLNVKKESYQLWDVQLNRARTASFLGEEQRDGLRTYKFEATTPLEKIGTRELPGGLFGVSDPSVVADAEYADTRTFWIEPSTGDVIGMHEVLNQQFRYNGRAVTALSATLDSPSLSGERLERTQQGAAILPWLRIRASYVLFGFGLLALLIWARKARGRFTR